MNTGGVVVLSGVKGGLRATSGNGPVVYSDDGEGNAEVISGLNIEREKITLPAAGTATGTGSRAGTSASGGQGAGAPRKSRLNISKAGGAVDLSDAPNGATLHTGGGGIRVARSGGLVDVLTGGGDIDLGAVSGSASASTGAGDVHITVVDANGEAHDVNVISGKGNVVLELPATLDARFELETAYTKNHRSKTKIASDFILEPVETLEWDDRYGLATQVRACERHRQERARPDSREDSERRHHREEDTVVAKKAERQVVLAALRTFALCERRSPRGCARCHPLVARDRLRFATREEPARRRGLT